MNSYSLLDQLVLPAQPDLPAPRVVFRNSVAQVGQTCFSYETACAVLCDLLGDSEKRSRYNLNASTIEARMDHIRTEGQRIGLPQRFTELDAGNLQNQCTGEKASEECRTKKAKLMTEMFSSHEQKKNPEERTLTFLSDEKPHMCLHAHLNTQKWFSEEFEEFSPCIKSQKMLRFLASMSVLNPAFKELRTQKSVLIMLGGTIRAFVTNGFELPVANETADTRLLAEISARYRIDAHALFAAYKPPMG